jgi:hypothetical protein
MTNSSIKKIAFVKQEVYSGLYCCDRTEKDAGAILFSTHRGTGPAGLFAEMGADFYIVKEEPDVETQIHKKVIPFMAQRIEMLKTLPKKEIPGWENSGSVSPLCQGDIAVSCYDVDWGAWDMVICINISLPAKLVQQYPNTLFAYMIGEGNMCTHYVVFGYDCTLNQKARGIVAKKCGVVDFPYAFLKGDTLENIMKNRLGRASQKKGVFIESNSANETLISHLTALPQEINQSQKATFDYLRSIYDSKYLVKHSGRVIRGNALAEALSLGCLPVANRKKVIHKELIADECNVKTIDDIVAVISYFEANPDEYNRILEQQRKILTELFFERPLQSLENCLQEKRSRKRVKRYGRIHYLTDIIVVEIRGWIKVVMKRVRAFLKKQ